MKISKPLQIGTLASLLMLTGCASIVSKSAWPVTFESTPPGAEVTVKNSTGTLIISGTTPTTLTLKSSRAFFTGATYYVDFNLNGYNPFETTLNSKINGWYWGNILLCQFGLIGGLIVDPGTGAMYALPDKCSAYLTEQNQQNYSPQGSNQK